MGFDSVSNLFRIYIHVLLFKLNLAVVFLVNKQEPPRRRKGRYFGLRLTQK